MLTIITTEIRRVGISWDDVHTLLSDGSEVVIRVCVGRGYWSRVICECRDRGITCQASDFGTTVPKIVDDSAVYKDGAWYSEHPLCNLNS